MANWSVLVYTPAGALVADLSGKQDSLRIEQRRNRADVITIRFDLDELLKKAIAQNQNVLDILAVNRNEIRVLRDDRVITAGQIKQLDASAAVDERKVEVRAVGWLDLFIKRMTGDSRVFAAVDAGTIAWTLISESEALSNGNFGVTQGTITTSQPRDRTYSYKNLKDAIIELSEVINGFDFEFTWDKKFNVYYPKIGLVRNEIILTYPGNIRELSYSRQGLEITNYVYARGGSFGTDALLATAQDTTSQSKYFLQQDMVEFNDVKESATLQQHADSEVLMRKDFTDIPDLKLEHDAPPFGSFGLGDIITCQVSQDLQIFDVLNGQLRVDGIMLDVDPEGVEDVSVKVMR